MQLSSEHLRGETKQLVNALRAPQVRGPVGRAAAGAHRPARRHGGALRLLHAGHRRGARTAACGPTWWCTSRAASRWWSTPRCRSRRTWRPSRAAIPTCTASGSPPTPASCASTSTRCRPRATGRRSTPSPEFVVLFVPGDPFLEAALQADPTLLEHAFSNNVVIATPTTLIALLRTVAYSWRQEALARNAAQVHQLGKELHSRLATMGTHVGQARPQPRRGRGQLQPDGVVAGVAGAASPPASSPTSRWPTTSSPRPARSSARPARSPPPSWCIGGRLAGRPARARADPRDAGRDSTRGERPGGEGRPESRATVTG